jgi:hypothetical protein
MQRKHRSRTNTDELQQLQTEANADSSNYQPGRSWRSHVKPHSTRVSDTQVAVALLLLLPFNKRLVSPIVQQQQAPGPRPQEMHTLTAAAAPGQLHHI